MAITITYDLRDASAVQRNYIRSMFERFGWRRLVGSVLRYDNPNGEEDWLNDVAPALMFFRSYVSHHGIMISFFTLDAQSIAHIDHSDPAMLLGMQPTDGANLPLRPPTHPQSSEKRVRRFVQSAIDVIK